MRAISGLWRWRRNPLCRATDLNEAWVALITLLLLLSAAPLAGVLVSGAAHDALDRSVREQHASRHRVTATVVRALGRSRLPIDPEGAASGDLRNRVVADWTAPDGTRHESTVMVGLDRPRAGDRFAIWTDAHGREKARPLDSATAATHAVIAGFGAAMLAAGLIETARRVTVRLMVRRRYARWEQEWERTGPDWGRTGAGS